MNFAPDETKPPVCEGAKPGWLRTLTHTVGLDVGTSRVTCIIGEPGDGGLVDIVGIGESEARGLRKGVVVDPEAAVESITRAVEEAERMSGLEAEEVAINLSGSHIMSFNGQAIVAVSGRERDPVARVRPRPPQRRTPPSSSPGATARSRRTTCAARSSRPRAIQLPAGREIVDRLPQEFIVDDQDGINDPVGMIGARLAVKVHIVTSPVTARQNVINAVNRAGLVVGEMVLEQLAAAEATLTDDDKEFGAALVDIGAETTGLIIYQRGAVQHTAVFALGGSHFTNDIAFGLRTPIPEAEKIKRNVGCASALSLLGVGARRAGRRAVGRRAPAAPTLATDSVRHPPAARRRGSVARRRRDTRGRLGGAAFERRRPDGRRRAPGRHGRDRRAGLRRARAPRLPRARPLRRARRRRAESRVGGRVGPVSDASAREIRGNAGVAGARAGVRADSARSSRNFAIVLVVFSE